MSMLTSHPIERRTTTPLVPLSAISSNDQPRSFKTSLDFILSPTSMPFPVATESSNSPNDQAYSSYPSPSPSTSSNPHHKSTTMPEKTEKRSALEKLPRDLLAHIAFHLVIDEPHEPYRRPSQAPRQHPSALIPLFLTSRTVYDSISFDNNPKMYNTLFRATFDISALARRYIWMQKHLSDQAGRGRKIFDLFSDPRSWAIDYKTRWEQSARMRAVVKRGGLEGVCTREQLVADLWNVWFLLTENDGRNVPFLARECDFKRWITVYYREDMLRDSLVPGYPIDTGEKALAIWCSLMSGTDAQEENTPAQVDEKIFLMRPYVFACAKYDITYAPWHHRRLPLCEPGCTDHEPDITLRSKAIPYKRFGYTWKRAPPHFILGMYLAFMRLVERQPGRMGLKPGSSTFTTPPGSDSVPGLFSISRILPSIYHDREWQRNLVCQDPHTSPGLPPLTFRGELEGFWRCKFLFYDFEMYRQILAGNIRGVYTGTFAEQAAEMQLEETVIKVRKEDVGGKGPLLCAGFDMQDEDYDAESERKRIQAGYGNEVCVNEEEPDEEGWTKEILISGVGRTSWGYADIRGRIRAWDGLVILSCYYPNHALGKWLWRGYLHTGGHLIGRWRDTFTSENLRGYEGAFGMIRAGDVYYPPQYPLQMDDSHGVELENSAGKEEEPNFTAGLTERGLDQPVRSTSQGQSPPSNNPSDPSVRPAPFGQQGKSDRRPSGYGGQSDIQTTSLPLRATQASPEGGRPVQSNKRQASSPSLERSPRPKKPAIRNFKAEFLAHHARSQERAP